MRKKRPGIIATLPPYAKHRGEIVAHPVIDGLRFNTVWEINVSERELLARLKDECGGKPLWIDLKGRQLRVTHYANMPYAFLRLNHRVDLRVPNRVLFKDGGADVVAVADGDKLVLDCPPDRTVGIGQPVNIVDPELRINGTLTDGDKRYIEAALTLGIDRFMLSFTESVADLRELDRYVGADAHVVLKIESPKGVRNVVARFARLRKRVHLMAARDDLYVQCLRDPVRYLAALERIVRKDPDAVAASRLLTSLEQAETPDASDCADIALLLRMGYGRFMLSDGVCFRRDAFRRATDVLWRLTR